MSSAIPPNLASSIIGGIQKANRTADDKNRDANTTQRAGDSETFARRLESVIEDGDDANSVNTEGGNGGGRGRSHSEAPAENTDETKADDAGEPDDEGDADADGGLDLRA
jgi:hypothetical protein